MGKYKKQSSYFFSSPAIQCQQLLLSSFYNEDTLNIFTDASMSKVNKDNLSYGAICVVQDTVIDFKYVPIQNVTINECEISGIRLALSFANFYKDKFKYINIFSDSLISVKGLREYIYSWKYSNNNLYTSAGKIVSNQSMFIECHDILVNISLYNPNIKIWHQSGHVNYNNSKNLIEAGNKFKEFNYFYGSIDLNFIRYISKYNDFIDHATRDFLNTVDYYCTKPLFFMPTHSY